jgi:hypothetical protein
LFILIWFDRSRGVHLNHPRTRSALLALHVSHKRQRWGGCGGVGVSRLINGAAVR